MWEIIVTVIFQIIWLFLKKLGADEEMEKKLKEFFELAANDNKSVTLNKAAKKQLEWIKKHPFVQNPVKEVKP